MGGTCKKKGQSNTTTTSSFIIPFSLGNRAGSPASFRQGQTTDLRYRDYSLLDPLFLIEVSRRWIQSIHEEEDNNTTALNEFCCGCEGRESQGAGDVVSGCVDEARLEIHASQPADMKKQGINKGIVHL